MPAYISILRGINVGGAKKIRMTLLEGLYRELGFTNVTTYIQSGNVIFSTGGKSPNLALASVIEKKIRDDLQFEVPVIIRTAAEMEAIIEANPFVKEFGIDEERLHVTFLSDLPAPLHGNVIQAVDFPPDRFVLSGKEVYLYCPDGYGRTKLNNTFFEKRLKSTATTRNWNTVKKLAEIAHKI
jgi:uncharacterized protein (DUF1697 family)